MEELTDAMEEPTEAAGAPSIDQMDYRTYHGTEGSWTPTVLLLAFFSMRYLFRNSTTFQRFVGGQRIRWRRRLGYRDDSKYRMGVGDGANMELERQG